MIDFKKISRIMCPMLSVRFAHEEGCMKCLEVIEALNVAYSSGQADAFAEVAKKIVQPFDPDELEFMDWLLVRVQAVKKNSI